MGVGVLAYPKVTVTSRFVIAILHLCPGRVHLLTLYKRKWTCPLPFLHRMGYLFSCTSPTWSAPSPPLSSSSSPSSISHRVTAWVISPAFHIATRGGASHPRDHASRSRCRLAVGNRVPQCPDPKPLQTMGFRPKCRCLRQRPLRVPSRRATRQRLWWWLVTPQGIETPLTTVAMVFQELARGQRRSQEKRSLGSTWTSIPNIGVKKKHLCITRVAQMRYLTCMML